MRIIACLLFAVIATASSSGPRDASELIQEYRAAAFLPIGRPVTYTPIKYLSEREVSTAVLAAGARLVALKAEFGNSEAMLANEYYPRVHLMMLLNKQADARDRRNPFNRPQGALHAGIAKQVSAMIVNPDTDLTDVARAVAVLRAVAAKAREYGIESEEDIKTLLGNMEDLIEVLVIQGRYCLGNRPSSEPVLVALDAIDRLMTAPPVRTDAAGWTATLAQVDTLVSYVRLMVDSSDARGDADVKYIEEVISMLSDLRLHSLGA